jgi:hypothetical protein
LQVLGERKEQQRKEKREDSLYIYQI